MDGIFDEDFIENIPRMEPIREYVLPNSRSKLKIFNEINPKLNKQYALCIDPAYRVNGDFAGIVVFDIENMEVEATAKLQLGKIRNLTEVVKFIFSLYPSSLVIVEKNNFGQSIIEELLEDHKIRQRMYYSYGNKDPYKMSEVQKADNKIYGIQTDKSSRPKMIDALIKYVNNSYEKLKSKDIINELLYLQEKKGGRIEAAAGQHDDMIMSLSFILYLIEYKERELKKFRHFTATEKYAINKIVSINDGKDNDFMKLSKMGYDLNATHSDAEAFNLDEFKNVNSEKSFLNFIINLNK